MTRRCSCCRCVHEDAILWRLGYSNSCRNAAGHGGYEAGAGMNCTLSDSCCRRCWRCRCGEKMEALQLQTVVVQTARMAASLLVSREREEGWSNGSELPWLLVRE